MASRCIPGVVCVENITMAFAILILCVITYLVYLNMQSRPTTEKIIIHSNNDERKSIPNFFREDVLLNPYSPPLKDDRYMRRVPINISTNPGAVDTNYRQVGILTPLGGSSKGKLLPLMGRPLFTNRDKWQYYTMSDQNNSVKLPVVRNGRSCTNEYGCDSLYNSDTVYIEGYNETYKVTMYDTDTIRYLPFF